MNKGNPKLGKVKAYLAKHPINKTSVTYKTVGKILGVDSEYVRGVWRKIKENTGEFPTKTTSSQMSHELNIKNNSMEITKTVDHPVKSLKDLVKICEIDEEIWTIDKYICNTWGDKWQVKAFMSLKKEKGIDYKQEFINFVERQNIKKLNSPSPIVKNKKEDVANLLVINCFDAHFGKFAWGEETGDDYDLKIAKARFINTVKSIALRTLAAYNIEEVVLCNGGDFIHFDNQRGETANKTAVECDSRYQKVFREACDALVECLEFLQTLFPRTKFININGNHDLTTSFYVGEYVKAFFKKDKNIEIDNSPRLRKYYQYGEVCIMATHGDKTPKKLPIIFSREFENFSKCKFPEIHLGHKHRESKEIFGASEELNGVLVRTFNSISGQDSWHSEEGFVKSIKKADGLIYHKEYGKIGEINEIIL